MPDPVTRLGALFLLDDAEASIDGLALGLPETVVQRFLVSAGFPMSVFTVIIVLQVFVCEIVDCRNLK